MNTQSFAQSSFSTHSENFSQRNDASFPVVENCVIKLPGKGIEAPVLFKTWIYDAPQSEGKSGREFLTHHRTDDYAGIITI